MKLLPLDHQNLILKWGGLQEFLAESPDFFVTGNFASLSKDEQKCLELAFPDGVLACEIGGMGAHEGGASPYFQPPNLNPDVAPFVPRKVMGVLSVDPSRFNSGMNSLDTLDDVSDGKHIGGLDDASSDSDSDSDDESIEVTSISSDDDEDDNEDDDEDYDDESGSAYHDAASDVSPKHPPDTGHSGDEGGPMASLDDVKDGNGDDVKDGIDDVKDGIDDDDYHWKDYCSSKDHTFEDSDNDDDYDDDGDDEREEEGSLITIEKQETEDAEKEDQAFGQTTYYLQGVQIEEQESVVQAALSEEQEPMYIPRGDGNETSQASRDQSEMVLESVSEPGPICNVDLGLPDNVLQSGKQEVSTDRDIESTDEGGEDGSVHTSLECIAGSVANDPTDASQSDISSTSYGQPERMSSEDDKSNDRMEISISRSETTDNHEKVTSELNKDNDSSSDIATESQTETKSANSTEGGISQIANDKDTDNDVYESETNVLIKSSDALEASQSQENILSPAQQSVENEDTDALVENSCEKVEIFDGNSLDSQESMTEVGKEGPTEKSDTEMHETSVETNEIVETCETSVVEPNCDMIKMHDMPTVEPNAYMNETHETPVLESNPNVTETHGTPVLESNPTMTETHETPVLESNPNVTETHGTPVLESNPNVTETHETPVLESKPTMAETHETSVLECNPTMTETHETPVLESNSNVTETHETPVLESKPTMAETHETPVLESNPNVTETHEKPVFESKPTMAETHETPVLESNPNVTETHEKPVFESKPTMAETHDKPVLESNPTMTETHETPVLESKPTMAETHETPVLESNPNVTETHETPVLESNPTMAETHETPVLESNPTMTETHETPVLESKSTMTETHETPVLESKPTMTETADVQSNLDLAVKHETLFVESNPSNGTPNSKEITNVNNESKSDEDKSENSPPRAFSDDEDEGTSVDGVMKVDAPESNASQNPVDGTEPTTSNSDVTESSTKRDEKPQSSTKESRGRSEKESGEKKSGEKESGKEKSDKEKSGKDGEEGSMEASFSADHWQELYEEKLNQWKQQRPPSPVHEMRTIGINTSANAWKLEEEVKELRVSS